METEGEIPFLKDHSGPLKKSYDDSGILPERLETPVDHAAAILAGDDTFRESYPCP